MNERSAGPFHVGDRVRLSRAGLNRKGARRGGYRGKIVRIHTAAREIVLTVLFDGNKAPTILHFQIS